MNIDDLTIKEAREIAALVSGIGKPAEKLALVSDGIDHGLPVGENVFVRTVTCYYTGRLERVTGLAMVLVDAAWVADTGRFHRAMESGELDEVEPYPDGAEVHVMLGAVCDVAPWPAELPREVK
jgi:hypothetical protein